MIVSRGYLLTALTGLLLLTGSSAETLGRYLYVLADDGRTTVDLATPPGRRQRPDVHLVLPSYTVIS